MAPTRCVGQKRRKSTKKPETSEPSSFFSKQLHTARELWTEGKVHYRFHPRFGEVIAIKRRLSRFGVDLVVVEQADGSLAQLPAWMLDEAAGLLGLRPEPRFPLEILRSLRAEVDALLGFLLSESDLEKGVDDADFRRSTAEPARTHRGGASHCAGSGAEDQAGDAGGSPACRNRRNARNGGRQ
jgi:hypothetical protein